MEVFRIAKERYKTDLSGIGAEKFGGRWNNKGTRMVYTSQYRSLAMLELAVHVSLQNLPFGFHLINIEVPDSLIGEFDSSRLQGHDWKSQPPLNLTQLMGDQFINAMDHVGLKVPSAIVEEEFNILLNPLHPEFKKVRVVKVNALEMDKRLIG